MDHKLARRVSLHRAYTLGRNDCGMTSEAGARGVRCINWPTAGAKTWICQLQLAKLRKVSRSSSSSSCCVINAQSISAGLHHYRVDGAAQWTQQRVRSSAMGPTWKVGARGSDTPGKPKSTSHGPPGAAKSRAANSIIFRETYDLTKLYSAYDCWTYASRTLMVRSIFICLVSRKHGRKTRMLWRLLSTPTRRCGYQRRRSAE